MSELRDEPASTFWPWVIGVAVLALVLWFAGLLTRDEQVAEPLPPSQAEVGASGAAFADWVRTTAPAARRQLPPREYAATALRRLAFALTGEASRHRPEVAPQADALEARVAAIAAAGDDTAAALAAADAMQSALEVARLLPARPDHLDRAEQVLAAWPAEPPDAWLDALDAWLEAMAAALA